MVKPFLRSGSLDDVLALGENGQPVYACAQQLRETLRLRRQQQAADCLAIPQPNESGTRIDWYAPFPGKVTSWLAASDAQRAQAVRHLEHSLTTFRSLTEQALATDHPSHRLFGALLAKAMHIPDPNHVYLVDDRPVLTFWGFIKPQAQSPNDPLACLRPIDAEMKVEMKVEVEKPAPIAAAPRKPAVVEPVKPAPAAPIESPAARRRHALWLLPVLLLGSAALAAWLHRSPPPQPAMPAEVRHPAPPKKTAAPLPKLRLPLAHATLMPPPPAPAIPQPLDRNALVLPPEAVKAGSTRFLNGKWRATVALKDPITGKRPGLQYRLNGGKGSAVIAYGDGVSCRVAVEAGLMQSGNLVINSRTKARCSDGSRYQIPEIVCRQGETGAAECTGRYDADTTYPMTFKRESK
ncbi:SrfA family protein [Serratia marcescens]|uniref:SrfA family protein n=1 Tax=Serratia marcescens TaxID=615 RepID=UPI002966CF87|nr:SrfA family protein [Serratia marcescens]WOX44120.1 SrfA family protein [Serratia marcescens]